MYFVDYLNRNDLTIGNSYVVNLAKQGELSINYNLNLFKISGSVGLKIRGIIPSDCFTFDIETNFFTIRNLISSSYEVIFDDLFYNPIFLFNFSAIIDISKNKYFVSELANQKLYYRYIPMFNPQSIIDHDIKFYNQNHLDYFLSEARNFDPLFNCIVFNNTYNLNPDSQPIEKFDSVNDFTFSVINEKYDPKRPLNSIFNFNYSPNVSIICKKVKIKIGLDSLNDEQTIEIDNPKIITKDDNYYVLFDKFYFFDKEHKKIKSKITNHTGLFIEEDSHIKVEAKFLVVTDRNFKFVNFTKDLSFDKQYIDNLKNELVVKSTKNYLEKGDDVNELWSEIRI